MLEPRLLQTARICQQPILPNGAPRPGKKSQAASGGGSRRAAPASFPELPRQPAAVSGLANRQRFRLGIATPKSRRTFRAHDDEGQAAGEGLIQERERGVPALMLLKLKRAQLIKDKEAAGRSPGQQRVAPGKRLGVESPIPEARPPQFAGHPAGEPAAGARVRGQRVEPKLAALARLGRREQAEHGQAGLPGLRDQPPQQAGFAGPAPAGEQNQPGG